MSSSVCPFLDHSPNPWISINLDGTLSSRPMGFTCPTLTAETLEQGVKYIQS